MSHSIRISRTAAATTLTLERWEYPAYFRDPMICVPVRTVELPASAGMREVSDVQRTS